jgi:hypothetical protein
MRCLRKRRKRKFKNLIKMERRNKKKRRKFLLKNLLQLKTKILRKKKKTKK